jgi:hypothetical protein
MNTNKKCKGMLFALTRELLGVNGDVLQGLNWQGGLAFPIKLATMYCPNDGQSLNVGMSIKSISSWVRNISDGDVGMVA